MEIRFCLKVNSDCCFPVRNLRRVIIHLLTTAQLTQSFCYFVCYHPGKYSTTRELTQCNTRVLETYVGLLVTFMLLICGMRLDPRVMLGLRRRNYLLKSTMWA